MEKYVLIIAPVNPNDSSGGGIALKSTIDLFKRNQIRIVLIYFVHLGFKLQDYNFENYPIFVKKRSLMSRFIQSMFSSYPAVCQKYVQARDSVKGLIHEIKSKYGAPLVVLFEDTPITCLSILTKSTFDKTVHIVRMENVLCQAFSEMIKARLSFFSKLAWRFEILRIKKFEKRTLTSFDMLWAISSKDAENIEKFYDISVKTIFGLLPTLPIIDSSQRNNNVIICIGTMDTRKSAGVSEFIKYSWPIIIANRPDTILLLAGQNTDKFTNDESGIVGKGFVQDISSIFSTGKIFVNPQYIGSGIKVKSIVAMGVGMCLVSTDIGVEGLDVTHKMNCMVSTNWNDMANNVLSLLSSEKLRDSLSYEAKKFVERNYSFSKVFDHMDRIIMDIKNKDLLNETNPTII